MRYSHERNAPPRWRRNEVVFPKTGKAASGQPTIGRIILDGKATATRADELSEWLKLRPFAGLPLPENVTGADWESKVREAPASSLSGTIGRVA